jgi:hypothetical protein
VDPLNVGTDPDPIRGSVLLTNGSGSDPAIFVLGLQDDKFFCLMLFEGTFTLLF